MNKNKNKNTKLALREIPSVDEIIEYFPYHFNNFPYSYNIKIIRKTIDSIREEVKSGDILSGIKKYTFSKIELALNQIQTPNLLSVINGTGIILHTGLGRAPLSKELIVKAMDKIFPYSNLEFNVF